MTKKYFNLYALLLITMIGSCRNDTKQMDSSEIKVSSISEDIKVSIYTKVKAGSFLAWRASHLGGLEPRSGKIYCKKANILVEKEKIVNASFLIDMNQLTVEELPEEGIKELTEHLKSIDFFYVEKYPTSKFELTKLKSIQGKYNSEIIGSLTILGVSQSISFKADIIVSDTEISIKSEDFIIDRSNWNMTYNAKGTIGIPLDYLISDEIGFTIDIIISK